jgi:dolichol-phosphate mannosyltransferase
LSPGRGGRLNNAPLTFGFAVRELSLTLPATGAMSANQSDLPNQSGSTAAGKCDCVFGTRLAREGRVVDYPWPKRILNRLGNTFIQTLFLLRYNDVTNAFKLYRRTVIAGVQPLLAYHFNLTVELPLKAIVRGYRYTVVPNSWLNRTEGVSKFKIREMGSRYLFIILYCYLEKLLSRSDYNRRGDLKESQLQVWSK